MIKTIFKINFISLILIFLSLNTVNADNSALDDLDISAESAIVIEQKSGRILYEKNIDTEREMASTTKIMTAIVALENGKLDEKVTVSERAAGIEGSSIWLEKGEQLTLEELLYGLMLSSGNDAAFAIGEHIGEGDIEIFIDLMNKKAKEINALDTKFANPHGLDHEDHFTTAHDLAKIAAYGMKNDTFGTIVSTKKKNISWPNHEWNRSINNKNKMLWNYEGGNGIKTGYTSNAGKCLVSSAIQNDMQLISVVLKSNDIWKDSTDILDYSFSKYIPYVVNKKDEYFKSIPVENGNQEKVSTYFKDEIIIPVTNKEKSEIRIDVSLPSKIEAPLMREQLVGRLDVSIEDEKINSSDIYIKESIRRMSPTIILKKFIDYWITQ